MTSKIYKSAQGKTVDLGTIMLKNEHVRAVGNMGVNARGDKLGSNNQVIETKSQQIQQQNNRTTTNVSDSPVHTSSKKARIKQVADTQVSTDQPDSTDTPDTVDNTPADNIPADTVAPVDNTLVDDTPVDLVTTPPQQEILTPPVLATSTISTDSTAPAQDSTTVKAGGLAGAIARSREIKQQLDPTRRQSAQKNGVRKI